MSELVSSTNHMACLLGMLKDGPHSSGLSSIDVKVKLMWPPARHTSFKRGGVSSRWHTWEEYLQLKPGEFIPDQIVAVMTQNQLKIDRTVARILDMFDLYSTSRLVAVIGCFECQVGADNSGERWR